MKRAVIFIFLTALTAISSFSQSDLQTIAIVNLIRTEPITVKQLRSEVEIMEKAAKVQLNPEQRKQVLDGMINERLVVQAAERDKIVVSDNEVNQQLQQLRAMLAQNIGRQPTDAEFTQAIRNEFGMEPQAYRDQTKRQLIVQKYLMAKKGDLLNSVKAPTEQEIQSEYIVRRSELLRPEIVRLSVIQVPYGSDAAARSKARELANNLLKEISSNPSKFDEVSMRSGSPNSGFKAGDAGYLPRNQQARTRVGDKFMDIAFSLKQGQVSSLIEGTDGFQIIKVTENHSEKILDLYDFVEPGSRVTVKDFIGQGLLNQRQQAVFAQASQEIVNELRAGRDFKIQNNLLNW
jgi:parvulin-like peptidyl-prolyl isomerase